MFRLLRYFSITSFISIVVAAAVLGLFYREIAVRSLVAMGESNNAALTRVLANSLGSTWAPISRPPNQAVDDAVANASGKVGACRRR